MAQFSFGLPADGIIQMAWIVPDLDAAMADWSRDLKIGPWYVIDHFTGINPVYRGMAARSAARIGLTFSGNQNIELIQMKDDHPSVYREMALTRGFGFHHFGLTTTDLAATRAQYQNNGWSIAYSGELDHGGGWDYMDPGPGGAHFVELISFTPGVDELMTMMWKATQNWDGRDPVRLLG